MTGRRVAHCCLRKKGRKAQPCENVHQGGASKGHFGVPGAGMRGFQFAAGTNSPFIACNHDVQDGMHAISVIETPYCTQQTGGLTPGMTLRPIHTEAADHARETKV